MRALAAAALLAASFAAAGQQADTFYEDDPALWGTLKRVVLPEYPKEMLLARRTGYVDFDGVVSPLNVISEVRYTPDSPESEPFVAALKEVVDAWAFYTPLDPECMPAETRVKNRIWFELDGDKPRISVSRGTAAAVNYRPSAPPVFRTNPAYPYVALRRGLSAYTYTRMRVLPDGTVGEVASKVYTQEADAAVQFERANERAFSRWRFPPDSVKQACMEVFFRLRN